MADSLFLEHDFLNSPAIGVDVYGTPFDTMLFPWPVFPNWLGGYLVGGANGIHVPTAYLADGEAGYLGGVRGPFVSTFAIFSENPLGNNVVDPDSTAPCTSTGSLTFTGDASAPDAAFIWESVADVYLFGNTILGVIQVVADPPVVTTATNLAVVFGANQNNGLLHAGVVDLTGVEVPPVYSLGSVIVDPEGPYKMDFSLTETDVTVTTEYDTVAHTFTPYQAGQMAEVFALGGSPDVTVVWYVAIAIDEDAFGFGPTVAISHTDWYGCFAEDIKILRWFPRDDDLGSNLNSRGRSVNSWAGGAHPTSFQRTQKDGRVGGHGYF